MSARRGIGVLAAVCLLAFAASLIVFALNTLWRGSSRSLHALQEDRQLTNLARSCLSEAAYVLQTQLEQSSSRWIDFFTAEREMPDAPVPLRHTPVYAEEMTNDRHLVRYTLSPVTVHRVEQVSYAAGMSGAAGAIDLAVTITVSRRSPAHEAKLTLTQRHGFWFSDAPTPFPRAGRHIEILPTPAATFREVE